MIYKNVNRIKLPHRNIRPGEITVTEEMKFNDSDLLRVAHKAAVECRKILPSYMKDTTIEFKQANTNPVTNADKAAEAITQQIIQTERPQDGLIGEEGSEKASKSGLRWVFDPLDGTVNYTYSIPHWAFSISCEEFDGSSWLPRIGLVYDFLRNEEFTAIRGGGARLNREPIAINNGTDLNKSLLATEFSYDIKKRIHQVNILSHILPKVRDVRSYGSSALDLCWVACGRLDGFYENDLKIWDWSAGSLIVQEAGGVVSPLEDGVIASGQGIHRQIESIVRQKNGEISIVKSSV